MKTQGSPLRKATGLTAFYLATFLVSLAITLGLVAKDAFAQPVSADVELEGTIAVLHEDQDVGSRYIYFLQTAMERLELRFATQARAFTSGDRVRVRGRKSNGVLALSSGSSVQTLATALPNTFGAQKTIVILINFYDNPTQPYTVSTAQNVFTTTSNFYLENSYMQTWLTGVVNPGAPADIYGWFTINQSSTVCNYSTTATLAEQAATAAGANLSQYTRKVYAFPKNACSWWGLGTVGGKPSKSWINGNLQLRVVGHEIGHNLGLYHSHSLDCGGSVVANKCTSSDYGDTLDIMGSSSYHYNAFQKERLGWLDHDLSPPITTVQADGNYWIAPYQSNHPDPKALKILKDANPSTGKTTYYYIEYRRPIGFDAALSTNNNVTNGVVIHMGTEADGNSSYLLDMTPWTSSWSDPALMAGQSYSDPDAGVTMTVLSADSTGATVSITFAGGGSTPCVRANPTVTLSPSSQSVAIGSTATYNVAVMNNDNSACSPAIFSLGAIMPPALTGSFTSSTLSIAPGSSSSTTLLVSSSSSASGGSYNFDVVGTNSGATSYLGSATGLQNLMASVSVSVATDKPVYGRKEWAYVKAMIMSGQTPIVGANVSFIIKKPNNLSVTGNATTDSSGTATYKYRFKRNDPTGDYGINAVVNTNGVSGSGNTSFKLQ